MGLLSGLKDFVEEEILAPIGDPLEQAFEAAGDYLKELGDDFGDWVRGDPPEIPGGTLTTTYADPSKPPLIYGTVKTGGRFIFEITEDIEGDPVNEILHYVVLYCEGGDYGIEGFKQHYFNNIDVTSGEFDGYYEIHEFTGAPGEGLPQALRDNCPQWTAQHTLDGWAGAYYRLRWKGGEGKQPFSRKPSITAAIEGLKIKRFDQGTARFSTDPIEIIWDYLRHSRYGWGVPLGFLAPVRDTWATESNFASQIVDGRKLMTCNVRLDLNRSRKQLLDFLRQDFRVNFPPRLGETIPVIEKDKAVVKVFDDTNIGQGDIVERPADITKRLNRVTIRWNDALDNYKTREYTHPNQSDHEILVAQDGGRVLEKTLTSHCINNEAEAMQLAFVVLNRSRHSNRLRIPIFSDDFDLEPTDLIQISNSDLGIVNGIYQIKVMDFEKSQIEVEEHDPSDYPWQGYTNQNPTPAPAPDLTKRWAQDVESVLLVVKNQTPPSPENDLTTIAVTVTPPTDLMYSHAELRYRLQGNTAWQYHWADLTPSGSVVVPYEANAVYEFQTRSISRYERPSDWVPAGNANLGSSTGPLPTITDLQLIGGNTFNTPGVVIAWNISEDKTPLYFSHYEIQIKNIGDGVLKTYETTNKQFTYSLAKNKNDSAGREFKVGVRCVSRTQDTGTQSVISVNNPVPVLPTGLEITSTQTGFNLSFDAIQDADFKGLKIWVAPESGFVPGPENLAVQVNGNQASVNGLTANTLYYMRYGLLDAFHSDNDTGTLSAEAVVTTAVNADDNFNNALSQARQSVDETALQQLIATGRDNALASAYALIGDDLTQVKSTIINLQSVNDDQVTAVNLLTLSNDQIAADIIELNDITAEHAFSLNELSLASDSTQSSISNLNTVTGNHATQLTTLSNTSGTHETSISNLNTVTTNQASTLTALALVSDNNTTSISSLNTVTADHATQLTTLSSTSGDHETTINNLVTISANQATALTQVQTDQASAGVILDSLAANGVTNANAGLYVDVDGALAGVFIGANDTSSEIVFKADSFKFKTAAADAIPFTITNENKIEFEGEINIDNGRVVITESILNLNSHRYKMGIDTVGLLHNGYSVGGIDIKTDGVALDLLSNGPTTLSAKNNDSFGTGLFIATNGYGVQVNQSNTALFVGSNQFLLQTNVTTANTFPTFWSGPGSNLGTWKILCDADGIWAANDNTWTNLLNGQTKTNGQSTNLVGTSSGGSWGGDPSR